MTNASLSTRYSVIHFFSMHFYTSLACSWEIANVTIEENCSSQKVLVLHHHEKASACSPLLNLSSAANLRFRSKPWYPSSDCQQSWNTKTNKERTNSAEPIASTSKLSVWIAHDTKRFVILQPFIMEDVRIPTLSFIFHRIAVVVIPSNVIFQNDVRWDDWFVEN